MIDMLLFMAVIMMKFVFILVGVGVFTMLSLLMGIFVHAAIYDFKVKRLNKKNGE
jgi:hypothetical protein